MLALPIGLCGALAGLKILVVEDEPFISFDIADCLEEHGAAVLGPCADVASALRVLSFGHDVHCATLDLRLRRGELSYPVAEALNARGISFMFLTGSMDEALLRYPDAACLPKPFGIDQLPAMIRIIMMGIEPAVA